MVRTTKPSTAKKPNYSVERKDGENVGNAFSLL